MIFDSVLEVNVLSPVEEIPEMNEEEINQYVLKAISEYQPAPRVVAQDYNLRGI